ncbi:MAG: DUF935 family protein, partial [Flavobacteriales bacterium]
MGIRDTGLYKKIEAFFITHADEGRIRVEAAARQGGGNELSSKIIRTATSLQTQSLNQWKTAILAATDPEEPSRVALKELYFNLTLDNHLMATVNNRIEAVQGSPFKLVDQKGAEREEMTDLFKKRWFIDFIEAALMSKYTGTKVVEIYKTKDNGQLDSVDAIDPAHVIPQKGIIVREPGDTTGWNYKEGVFKDYYLQVGKDNQLGLFAMLAPIVLAKKLGVGSWLDYIDKYGIPPMFVTTDREDRKRFEELYESMTNFKSAHFAVLRGQEQVNFSNAVKGGNADIFKELTELANNEISKRINGATGTVDEKTYTGAAQVHADILKTKIRLDKFFIEVLVNEELVPRLVKVSSVYRSLDNYTFKWDDAESLSLEKLIEAVRSLSPYYKIDTDYLSQKTGIPLKRLEEQGAPALPPADGKKARMQKKSLDQTALGKIAAFYQNSLPDPYNHIQAISLAPYQQLIEKIAKGLHKGSIKAEDLHQGLIEQTFDDLMSATKEGWGTDWSDFESEDATKLKMQKNIYRFSQAKTYAELKTFNSLLYTNGEVTPYDAFKKQVLKVNRSYNLNYLQAEYQTARQASAHARNWQQFQKDKDLFPNLEYKTAADERVRSSHAKLHGVIKPIGDSFWDKYYPPNGWRCRCYGVQSDKPVTEDMPKLAIKEEFQLNTGKTGSVFSEKHPYFALAVAGEGQVH